MALFRFRNQKATTMIEDYSKQYDTITDFLKNELNIRDIKEIIPHRKYVFSALNIICSFTKEVDGMKGKNFVLNGAEKTSNVIHCNKPAKIYSHVDGKPVCFEHSMR